MGNLAITVTELIQGSQADITTGTSGAAITEGQVLYIDTTDSNRLRLADADASAATAVVAGISVSSCAAAAQSVSYQHGGTITIGSSASVSRGEIYVLSGDAGGIAPEADLAGTDSVSILGVGNASDQIVINIHNSAVTLS